MKNYDGFGVTQKVMSVIANVNPSTINKMVSLGDFVPVNLNVSRNIRYNITDTRNIIKKFILKNNVFFNKKLSFYNFKGGVGKTTLCYQVSSMLAIMGFNVLVVDADPQGHLSTSFGFDTDDDLLTLYDVIIDDVPIKEAIKNIYPGLDCLPANIALSRLEPALNQLPKREERISICLKSIEKDYDFIIFDSNPTISHVNRNVLTASDMVCVVVETQAYALNGLKILLNDLKNFCKSSFIDLPELLIIPNKYDERTAASGEAMSVLKNFYGEYVMPDFAIRRSEEFNTSGKTSQPLSFFCRANSIALEDVRDVVYRLIEGDPNTKSAAAESLSV
jgi:chromosome partitioning protein